jgi:hypothetical protein
VEESAHAKLLQRPLNEHTSAKHADLFKKSIDNACYLVLCVGERHKWNSGDGGALSGPELLGPTLAARPVSTLARLLVWLQQRPDLLELPPLSDQSTLEGFTCPVLWFSCSRGTTRCVVREHTQHQQGHAC